MPFDLHGRTAIVTGASSGLGARFAVALAGAGANVVLTARRADRLDDVRSRISAAHGKAIAVAMDVTDEQSVISAYDAGEKAFGTIDTIFANAGVASPDTRATDLPIEQFDAIMATNVRGVFLTLREGAKRLIAAGSREKQHGRAIITASTSAKKVYRSLSAYGASKAAALHMGRVLAADWARSGINVNMILPGYIETELNQDLLSSEAGQRLISSFPHRRLIEPTALDEIILYLASDASRFVTGAEFLLDDGQTL